MISVSEADRILGSLLPAAESEAVPLAQAGGRCLAVPVSADRDGPPFDRVAMDGYAVRTGTGLRSWPVRGLQVAGRPPLTAEGPGVAVEVATGAVLPLGCDAVVPYEHTNRTGDAVSLKEGQPTPEPGRHVHRRGTDFCRGEVLFPAGTVLRSTHLHSLASVGLDPVPVVRRPVWSLGVTGDELTEVAQVPEAWQIRRSNAAAIAGEARAWGLTPRAEAVLPDDPDELRVGLERLLPGLDVLVLTGGVSAGALDLVPGALASLGAETLFHKIAQRPGKPLWCGRIPAGPGSRATLVFGLPGNPVSSLFSFRRFVLPWLLAAEGRPVPVRRLAVPGLTPPAPGQTVFLPWSSEHGLLDWRGSGDYRALADSSGFLEVDDDARSLTEPKYYPWGGLW
jgi:molybdopterin molybdotransferase